MLFLDDDNQYRYYLLSFEVEESSPSSHSSDPWGKIKTKQYWQEKKHEKPNTAPLTPIRENTSNVSGLGSNIPAG